MAHWYVSCLRILRFPVQTLIETKIYGFINDAGSMRSKIFTIFFVFNPGWQCGFLGIIIILSISLQFCANQLMEIWQRMLILLNFSIKILPNHKRNTEKMFLTSVWSVLYPKAGWNTPYSGFGVRTKCVFQL